MPAAARVPPRPDVDDYVSSATFLPRLSFLLLIIQYTVMMHTERVSGARNALRKMVPCCTCCELTPTAAHMLAHTTMPCRPVACLFFICTPGSQGVQGYSVYAAYFIAFMLEVLLVSVVTSLIWVGLVLKSNPITAGLFMAFGTWLFLSCCWATALVFRCVGTCISWGQLYLQVVRASC